MRIKGLKMLVFQKILRTYLIDGPLWEIYKTTVIVATSWQNH